MLNKRISTTAPLRVASYSRFSTDMQRLASIEDQQRNCREAAERKGWIYLTDYQAQDQGASGTTIEGREGFKGLIDSAVSGKAPFDGIIVDDTSRFGRNLKQILTVVDQVIHAGVFLYFVSKDLDSTKPNFRDTLVMYAHQDEQHSVALGQKVHRGMRGRVLAGYIAQGRTYGYRNIKIIDEERKGRWGEPAVKAFDLEVYEPEAEVLRRMFLMKADGLGDSKIARIFQAEGIPAARSDIRTAPSHWHAQTVKRMLSNEKYKGLHVWNKTSVRTNPNTDHKEKILRRREEWEEVRNEKWRIVSDELWEAAQVARKTLAKKFRPVQLGGQSRSKRSEEYIFSGLLKCANCDGFLRIFSTREVSRRYICFNAFNWGGCKNRDSIHIDALQIRLLKALKSAAGEEMVRELTSKIVEAELIEEKLRSDAPSIQDLEASLLLVGKKLDDLYDMGPDASHNTVFMRHVNSLEKEYDEINASLTSARQIQRPLMDFATAQTMSEQLVSKFRTALDGHPYEVKPRMRLQLRPIQVSWEMRGKEKMAVLLMAVDFRLNHSEETISLPLKIVLSTDYKRDRDKRCSQEDIDLLCAEQEVLTSRQITDGLRLSRTTVRRWCSTGLAYYRVPTPNCRQGIIKIRSQDLIAWLQIPRVSPSEIVICPPEVYPKPPVYKVERRRRHIPINDGLEHTA